MQMRESINIYAPRARCRIVVVVALRQLFTKIFNCFWGNRAQTSFSRLFIFFCYSEQFFDNSSALAEGLREFLKQETEKFERKFSSQMFFTCSRISLMNMLDLCGRILRVNGCFRSCESCSEAGIAVEKCRGGFRIETN
jgi:hypothetical protein